jgi:ATP-binding cassette subfamily B protein
MFFSYYGPYKRLLAADILTSAVSALAALAIPLCIRDITQTITASDIAMQTAMAAVMKDICLMSALIALNTACHLFYDSMGHIMGARMERDMRDDLFSKYMNLPFSFFDREKTGKLISRMTGDLLNLAEIYHHGPENIFIYGLSFIAGLMVLFSINRTITLVVLLFFPVIGLYSFFSLKRLYRSYKINREKIAGMNAGIEDSISGIRVTKSFANETKEKEKFTAVNNAYYNARSDIYKNEAFYDAPLNYFLIPLMTAAVILFGSIAISRKTLSAGDLIIFLLYVPYLTSPVQNIAWLIPMFQNGFASFTRFAEIMEKETEHGGGKTVPRKNTVKGDIVFDKVCFKYYDHGEMVLDNVSLHITPDEYIAIAGESGIGKTTLCSLIPRYYDIHSGAILLDGKDIRDYSLESLRQNIGVVQQDVYLFSGTVRENIMLGAPAAANEELIEAAKKANAHDFILGLPDGYDTYIGTKGVTLSGGQRQRISIARVFLKNPPVLIFDEATSALDNESEEKIKHSLAGLKTNRTTIVIAHRLSTIKNADRILVLSDKGIAEQGNHGKLFSLNGIYTRLYKRFN